jgi:hypothetical protein
LLLNTYFLLEVILVRLLPQAIYIRSWALYDWIYRAAVKLAPFDIPDIYEGVHDRHGLGGRQS